MKKTLILLCFTAFLCAAANAQFKLPKVLLAVHVMYNAPGSTNFKNAYNGGVGGEAQVGLGFGSTLLTGTLGYGYYDGKDGIPNITYTPMELGLRQYFLMGKLFINGNAGVAMVKPKGGSSSSNFMAEGGAGVKLLGIEFIANYGGWKNKDADGWAAAWMFKAGYSIKL